jgi:hypothetical protein
MGYDLPRLGKDLDAIPILIDPILKGTINVQGTMSVGGVSFTQVKCLEVNVDCSAGGTAQTTAIGTVPIGSIILEVLTYCTQAFDGDATTTFSVGVTGNTNKYIDPVDCPVTLAGVMCLAAGTNNDQKVAEPLGAAMAIIATWTNTANATAGKVTVKVVYC